MLRLFYIYIYRRNPAPHGRRNPPARMIHVFASSERWRTTSKYNKSFSTPTETEFFHVVTGSKSRHRRDSEGVSFGNWSSLYYARNLIVIRTQEEHQSGGRARLPSKLTTGLRIGFIIRPADDRPFRSSPFRWKSSRFLFVCRASVDAVPDAISFRKALFMTAFRLHPCPSLFWLPTAHIFDLGTRAHTHTKARLSSSPLVDGPAGSSTSARPYQHFASLLLVRNPNMAKRKKKGIE